MPPRPLLPSLRTRALADPGSFPGGLLAEPAWTALAPAPVRDAAYPGAAPLHWLALDPAEGRFLLAAGGDGSVVAYDVGAGCEPSGGSGARAAKRARAGGSAAPAGRPPRPPPASLPPLFHARRGEAGGHTAAVTGVAWYPVDAGAFVSGGADGTVKLWDANGPSAVVSLRLGGRGHAAAAPSPPPPPRVHCVAMSPASAGGSRASHHALVAVGCGAGGADHPAAGPADAPGAGLRLADPAGAGTVTHHLAGHAGAVWAAAWSPACEWSLVSGGADGGLRVWDVRRAAACVRCLDGGGGGGGGGGSASTARASRRLAAGRTPPPPPQPAGDDGGPPPPRRAGRFSAPASHAAAAFDPLAHDGAVTGLAPTPDGLGWVSAGTDGRVRVWEGREGGGGGGGGPAHCLPWALAGTHNAARRPRQLAVGGGPAPVLFHPSGSVVQVLPLPGGAGRGPGAAVAAAAAAAAAATPAPVLRGHVAAVHAAAWCEGRRELYTGGDDRAILVWAPERMKGGGGGDDGGEGGGGELADADAWSDEELSADGG